MSQYLLSVHGNLDDATPPEAEMQRMFAAVDAFNTDLQATGKWVFAGGLHPISSATVVNATGAEPVVTDGPYAEAKEFLGGFWVIEAEDLDEALALATRGSSACGAPVEVRPFQDV
ncbi:conserved hypothetical protein [metagenome]|uniref:YCII-related domain-containing protein n=1 Tax=metagenome TaxID=256318 RepID=A0A2P2BWW7_9ZZZZ